MVITYKFILLTIARCVLWAIDMFLSFLHCKPHVFVVMGIGDDPHYLYLSVEQNRSKNINEVRPLLCDQLFGSMKKNWLECDYDYKRTLDILLKRYLDGKCVSALFGTKILYSVLFGVIYIKCSVPPFHCEMGHSCVVAALTDYMDVSYDIQWFQFQWVLFTMSFGVEGGNII